MFSCCAGLQSDAVMEKSKAKHKADESSDQPKSKVPRTEKSSDLHDQDVNIVDWFRHNDLFNSVLQGDLEVVQAILSHQGKYVDITDAFGQTALFAAVWQGNVEVVQALLSHGVDVSITDEKDQTALFAAAEEGNVEVVQVLLSHGVDMNITDQNGQTALFAAVQGGNVEVVRTLLNHGFDVNVTDELGQTALFVAAQGGNVEVVQALLGHGVDVNVTDEEDQTGLFAAVEGDNVEVVQALLSHYVDVNITDQYGQTALFAAAEGGNVEILQDLLIHGINVNVTDFQSQTALFDAARQGNVKVVQSLLDHGVDVNITDDEGQTALFAAAEGGNVEVVRALLGHGVDVNVTDQYGQTALFNATNQGNVEVVQSLLNHGVDVNVSDDEGQTALFAAAEGGNLEVVEALLSHGADVNVIDQQSLAALFAAAEEGNVKVVQALLSHGVDVNVTNQYDQTALFAAAESGSTEVVQALLSHGVDVNAIDRQGLNALFAASEEGNVEVVRALLSHGVDVNVTDFQGQIALFDATRQGNVEVVQALLGHGVDVNVIDQYGQTVLFDATSQGNVEIVQALLSHGVHVNVTDFQGQTALFDVARQGNIKVIQSLLSHGVDVNVTDEEGQSALFVAAEGGNVEVVQALLSHGVDVNISDEKGLTALFPAAWQGNVEIVQALLSHGVDVNVTNRCSQTALFADATKHSNVEVVQALLNHGVDVNVTDFQGQTAMFVATRHSNIEVVQALLSHDVDVNVTDQYGQTVLFDATRHGNVEVVEALLSHGVDGNVTDFQGQTALFDAARQGNVEVIQALLGHGVDVNITDEEDQTALFAAAQGGNVEVVQALLSHGVDVSVTDEKGQTALFAAAGGGNVEVVQALLSHGVDVSVTDEKGQTALFCAVQNGNIAILESLVKHGANRGTVDNAGNSAIFYTAQLMMNGVSSDAVITIVKFLMSHKGNADPRNAAGQTLLLHYLSYPRMKEMERDSVHTLTMVCQFLIESEVDVNMRTQSGHSVIHLLFLLLRDILKQETPRVQMAFRQKVQATSKLQVEKSLLKLICSIPSCPSFSRSMAASRDDADGNTPLHLWASLPCPREWNTEDDDPDTTDTGSSIESIVSATAAQLLFSGAQVNATNGNGKTPLHMAKTWNAAKFLLDRGALPNGRDLHGDTPLLSCIKNKVIGPEQHHFFFTRFHEVYDNMKAQTVKMHWKEILNSDMDPWKGNDKGTTILMLLLQAYAFDVIQALLEATEAPNGQKYPVDSNGDTSLHVICRDNGEYNYWKLNLIDYLVPSGAPIVNCTNRKGKTALHIVCQRRNDDPLSCEIIQRLRAYGARVDIADDEGKTCLDIAVDKPKLMTLLTQDIQLFETDPWLPWSSRSEKHKDSLAQVARGQNAHQTGSLYYHTTPIGSGAFGYVYAGLDSKDGREVAVKRVEKVRMCRPEDRREVTNLVRLAGCEHVVQYLSYHGDQDFLCIVLELMEGTLDELLNGQVEMEEVSLCKDVVSGLEFLHQNNIIHRDIKPGNILYKRTPKLSLKLADFGLSGRAANVGAPTCTTTVMHSKAGTRCWMAPELLKGIMRHSKASDVFACGLVLHYLLSRKKHPFGPTNVARKGVLVIENETVANILNNKVMVDGVLSHEAQDLVKMMVNCNKDDRHSTAESLRHPLFWSNNKKVAFLTSVGNQAEVERPRHFAFPPSPVEEELENAPGLQFATYAWAKEVPQVYAEMTQSRKSRKYVTSSAVDLLRFVRNTYAHVGVLTTAMKTSVLTDYVFFSRFPTLVIDVYKAVTSHGWHQREEIASAMTAA